MRDYGKISTSIWNSRKFAAVDDDARLLYFYLHTCPHVNSVGCFVLKDGYAAADLGWEIERYQRAIEALCKGDLIGFDRPESIVRIVGFLTFDPITNVNHAKGAIKLALALPETSQKSLVLKDLCGQRFTSKDANLQAATIGLSKGYATPEPEPEPEPDKEKDGGGGSASAKIEPEKLPDGEAEKPPSDHPQQSHREQILAAIGVDPVSGLTGHGGGRLGTQADMAHAERWAALGLPPDDQIAVVVEVMARKSDGPPSSFRFFDKAMERLAGARTAGPLAPQAPVPGRAQPPLTAVKFDLAALLAKHPELDR